MTKRLLLVMIVGLLWATTATAVEVIGVSLPDKLTVDGNDLVLNGDGARQFLFLDFYAGALYTKAKKTSAAEILDADEPLALYIHWTATSQLSTGQKVIRKGFANSRSVYPYENAEKEAEQFISLLQAPKDGTIWQLQYTPGKGTTYLIDGTAVGTIAGNDFKKNLFGVWLLENDGFRGDKRLRDQLLGNR